MTDTIQNVVHFVPAPAGELLEDLGAEEIVEFKDVLSHGPSREEPKDHGSSRLDYWRGLYERVIGADGEIDGAIADLDDSYLTAEQLGSVAKHFCDDRRIVVWSTPAFEDRLFLWMVFDAALKAGVPTERLATAEPQVPVPPDEEDFYAIRDLAVDELVEGFDELLYPEGVYVEAGAQLWQTFASASPRQFAISVPHTDKFFPNIATIAENYGWMFPTVEGEGGSTMELSRFDEQLLESVSAGWTEPIEVLGAEFVEPFHFVDDLAIAARLVDWAETPYLESREAEESKGGLFERHAYRLTEEGEELIEEGFTGENDAPILLLGDCRIYAGQNPWVKVVEDEYWWFERFSSE